MTLLTLDLLLSSRYFLSILFSVLICGCGVKSDPRPPQDTILPSIGEQYLASPYPKSNKDKDGEKEKLKKVETKNQKEEP